MENKYTDKFKIRIFKDKHYYIKGKYFKAQKDAYLPLTSFTNNELGQFTEEEFLVCLKSTLITEKKLPSEDYKKLLVIATNLYDKYKYFCKRNIALNKLTMASFLKKILIKLYLFFFPENNEKFFIGYCLFLAFFIAVLPAFIITLLEANALTFLFDNFLFNTLANFINNIIPFNELIIARSKVNQQHTSLILAYGSVMAIIAPACVLIAYYYKHNLKFNNLEQEKFKIKIKKSAFSQWFVFYIGVFLLLVFAFMYYFFIIDINYIYIPMKSDEVLKKIDIRSSLTLQYIYPLSTVAYFTIIALFIEYLILFKYFRKTYKKIYKLQEPKN